MMEWIIDNWYIVVGLIALSGVTAYSIVTFTTIPTANQIAKVKEWLLYAVTLAEKELGSGTGALKLRHVYDLFVTKFPWMVKVVSFDTFSDWVDEALVEMRRMLEVNDNVAKMVKGDKE